MTFLRNDLWCHRSLRQSEREKEEVITNAWWIASHVWRAHLFPRRFYPLQTCRPFSPLSLWGSYFHLSRDVMMSPIFVDGQKDLWCISELGQRYQKSKHKIPSAGVQKCPINLRIEREVLRCHHYFHICGFQAEIVRASLPSLYYIEPPSVPTNTCEQEKLADPLLGCWKGLQFE